ncbi:MAG: hypothetical protein ABI901_08460 [Roseiflexaceae bacterium]
MAQSDDFERARLAREAEHGQRRERCKALFRELDPVVQRVLREHGDALWGQSPFAPHYTIHAHRNIQGVVVYCADWILLHTDSAQEWWVALHGADPSAGTVDHFAVKCPTSDWVATLDITELALKHALMTSMDGAKP